jgi:hypothetical protein
MDVQIPYRIPPVRTNILIQRRLSLLRTLAQRNSHETLSFSNLIEPYDDAQPLRKKREVRGNVWPIKGGRGRCRECVERVFGGGWGIVCESLEVFRGCAGLSVRELLWDRYEVGLSIDKCLKPPSWSSNTCPYHERDPIDPPHRTSYRTERIQPYRLFAIRYLSTPGTDRSKRNSRGTKGHPSPKQSRASTGPQI